MLCRTSESVSVKILLILQIQNLPKGETYREPVISLDVFATAASLAGVKLNKRKAYDGVDLVPHLTGKNKDRPHEQLFWRTGNRSAIRVGDWKLLRNPGRGQSSAWQLYNLATDIGEQHNLADQNPDKVKELLAAYEKMNSKMIEPVWTARR